MFDSFDKEHCALVIFIEGKEYYYPLESYQCMHLPITGSRVLIFKSENEDYFVYGFNVSKIIDPIEKVEAEIKAIVKQSNMVKLFIENLGYITTIATDNFFNENDLKLGENILVNKISIDGDYYFSLTSSDCINSNRNNILKLLYKE